MQKILLVLLGLFLASIGVSLYNSNKSNSESIKQSTATSGSKSSNKTGILDEVTSALAAKLKDSNKDKTSESADKSSSESTSESTTSSSTNKTTTTTSKSTQNEIKSDIGNIRSSLLNACPSYSSGQSIISDSTSTETALGVTQKSLVCKDGNYQACLESCFADLSCGDECPCINSCYEDCKSFIVCGQWSGNDIITEVSNINLQNG